MSKLPPHALNKAARGVYEAPMAEYFSVLKPMTLLSNAYFSADAAVEEYQEDSPEVVRW